MNGIVAGLAGAFKDLADETGGEPVRSPIFAHPQFERLEAEGRARKANHIEQAITAVRASVGE